MASLVLNIRVLAGMRAQQFVVPLGPAGPATLAIRPGDFGAGHRITVLDAAGEQRDWYAYELLGVHFEETGGKHDDTGHDA